MTVLVSRGPVRLSTGEVEPDGLDPLRPYASVAYGRSTARGSDGTWCAIVGQGWRLSVVLDHPAGVLEATSPYGYAGLSIAEELTEDEVERCWAATRRLLADAGAVSLFVRFPPFLPEQAERARALEGLHVRRASDTVLVDTVDAEALWDGLSASCRKKVRRAERDGLSVRVERFDADDRRTLAEFRRLYDATMDRLDAAAHLRFDDEYYRTLADGLGDDLLLSTVRRRDGEAVAVCLLIDDHRTIHTHLSGSTPPSTDPGANNLLLWSALRTANELGRETAHLGGGTRPGDSLFQFKASFGGRAVPFHVGRAVIDAERYDALVAQRAQALGTTPEALDATGYFPAFRAPAPQAAA